MLRRPAGLIALLLPLALAGCGNRTMAEKLLFSWAQALNTHLATDADGNYTYPHSLADIDPLLRITLTFDDPWGTPLRYRRIDDGHYDLVSAGPNATLGDDDDLVIHNGLLEKPAKVYARRPAERGLVAQEAPVGEGSD